MFLGCEYVKTIIIPPIFNTAKVVNMDGMFEGCKNLISLDLSSFDTKNVYDMSDMFMNCRNLTDINLSSLDVKIMTFLEGMFYGCSNKLLWIYPNLKVKKLEKKMSFQINSKNIFWRNEFVNRKYWKIIIIKIILNL